MQRLITIVALLVCATLKPAAAPAKIVAPKAKSENQLAAAAMLTMNFWADKYLTFVLAKYAHDWNQDDIRAMLKQMGVENPQPEQMLALEKALVSAWRVQHGWLAGPFKASEESQK